MQETLDLLGGSILLGALLVLVSILLGQFTAKTGFPMLLIFLVIGMLAGEDGPGRVEFNDYALSFWLGNIALAVILLDGGLRTQFSMFRVALKPAAMLATLGVLLTCGMLTLAGHFLMGLSWTSAFLFGAIVSSTDAAAVFALLNGSGLRLNERVLTTLEVESGLNDPMAVFLTLVAILVASASLNSAVAQFDILGLSLMAIQQIGVGLIVPVISAYAFRALIRILRIEASHNHGLNALLLIAAGLTVFGLSTMLEGSGFLSIYVFGVLLADLKGRFVRTVIPAMDGLAWLFQASMFLLLGLLVMPSEVIKMAIPGLVLALMLMFVIRPLAVWVCLVPFKFTLREIGFVAWVGLRGAVPIILALFPIMAGVDPGHEMLSLAFMAVLLSLLIQGVSLSHVARALGMVLPDADDRKASRKVFGDFMLDGAAPAQDVADFYGLKLDSRPGQTMADWLAQALDKPPVVGDEFDISGHALMVSEMDGGRITKVGVRPIH
ncbi:MAG: potassium/proton antiporter [Burkholderiaceae bacterium]|jgi:cell volume regulation protein A